MKGGEKRFFRLEEVYKLAITGKYDWKALKNYCTVKIGVTAKTADGYLEDIKKRLIKEELLTE